MNQEEIKRETLKRSASEREMQVANALDPSNPNFGWKIHLNFDATDPDVVLVVVDYLKWLKQQGEIKTFKIGKGGGIEWDQPGKEATVYIGDLDQLIRVGELIEKSIGDVLLAHDSLIVEELQRMQGIAQEDRVLTLMAFPHVDTLVDDLFVVENSTKIMARFTLNRHPDFAPYGAYGVPSTLETTLKSIMHEKMGVEKPTSDDVFKESFAILSESCPEYFLGTQDRSLLPELKRKQVCLEFSHKSGQEFIDGMWVPTKPPEEIIARAGERAKVLAAKITGIALNSENSIVK